MHGLVLTQQVTIPLCRTSNKNHLDRRVRNFCCREVTGTVWVCCYRRLNSHSSFNCRHSNPPIAVSQPDESIASDRASFASSRLFGTHKAGACLGLCFRLPRDQRWLCSWGDIWQIEWGSIWQIALETQLALVEETFSI